MALAALVCGAGAWGDPALAATPAGPVADLTGEWVLNPALSQPSPLPRPRSGARAGARTGGRPTTGPIAPEDSVLPDPPARLDAGSPRTVRRRPPSWLYRPERLEALRVILGESRQLSIVQGPRYVDLRTDTTARSLEPGADSQVSLPTGDLADQEVRWRGRRLVVERRVPRGMKLVETYERLAATDQLRVTVRRSGSSSDGLGRIEWLRVFDRDTGPATTAQAPGPRAEDGEDGRAGPLAGAVGDEGERR